MMALSRYRRTEIMFRRARPISSTAGTTSSAYRMPCLVIMFTTDTEDTPRMSTKQKITP